MQRATEPGNERAVECVCIWARARSTQRAREFERVLEYVASRAGPLRCSAQALREKASSARISSYHLWVWMLYCDGEGVATPD